MIDKGDRIVGSNKESHNNFIGNISILLLSSHCLLVNITRECDRGAVGPVYMNYRKDMTPGQKYYTEM